MSVFVIFRTRHFNESMLSSLFIACMKNNLVPLRDRMFGANRPRPPAEPVINTRAIADPFIISRRHCRSGRGLFFSSWWNDQNKLTALSILSTRRASSGSFRLQLSAQYPKLTYAVR